MFKKEIAKQINKFRSEISILTWYDLCVLQLNTHSIEYKSLYFCGVDKMSKLFWSLKPAT